MPPASLSTFAVMIPGPRMAKKIVRRRRQFLTSGRGAAGAAAGAISAASCRPRRGCGWRRSTTSSIVMMPTRTPSGSVTGRARRSYLDIVSATSPAETSGVTLRTGVAITFSRIVSSSAARRSRTESAPRMRSLLVHDVEVEERLGVARDGPEPLDRLAHRERGRKRDEVGSHESAGRVLVVHEELGDLLGRPLLHELDEVARVLALDLAEDVRRLVRGHLLEDLRGARLRQVLDDLGLDLGLELVQRLGSRLDVQLLEDAGALGARDLAQDFRDVGRVEPLELLLRQGGLEPLEARVQRLHRVPRNEARRQRRVGKPAAARRDARPEDPPHEAAHAHVGGREDEVSRKHVQLEVVHPHDLHAVDVHDLLVEEVPREKDLVLPRGAVQEVLPHETRAHGVALEDGNVFPGQHERLEAVPDQEARDPRKRSPRARGDGEVRDLSDRVPAHVAHRFAEEFRDEESLMDGHRGRARGQGRRRLRHESIVGRRHAPVNASSGYSQSNGSDTRPLRDAATRAYDSRW